MCLWFTGRVTIASASPILNLFKFLEQGMFTNCIVLNVVRIHNEQRRGAEGRLITANEP